MDSVKIAGWIAVGVSLVLVARVLLIDNPEAIIIVVPSLLGGVAVVAWPWLRSTQVVALVLIGATAVYSLIGWIGFLYLPSLVLIARGVVRPRRVPAYLRGQGSAPAAVWPPGGGCTFWNIDRRHAGSSSR
jgi:hypothetical protein